MRSGSLRAYKKIEGIWSAAGRCLACRRGFLIQSGGAGVPKTSQTRQIAKLVIVSRKFNLITSMPCAEALFASLHRVKGKFFGSKESEETSLTSQLHHLKIALPKCPQPPGQTSRYLAPRRCTSLEPTFTEKNMKKRRTVLRNLYLRNHLEQGKKPAQLHICSFCIQPKAKDKLQPPSVWRAVPYMAQRMATQDVASSFVFSCVFFLLESGKNNERL